MGVTYILASLRVTRAIAERNAEVDVLSRIRGRAPSQIQKPGLGISTGGDLARDYIFKNMSVGIRT